MKETDLHRAVAAYLAVVLPLGAWWTTVAHGGFRVPAQVGARLKSMGLRPGVPDLMIVHDGRALFVELKARRGVLSDQQRDCITSLRGAGASVAICRSIDDVARALLEWRVPMRARIAA